MTQPLQIAPPGHYRIRHVVGSEVAKIGVTAAATVVFCELLSFVSFFLGAGILSGGGARRPLWARPAPSAPCS
jgi:hypothetical protein